MQSITTATVAKAATDNLNMSTACIPINLITKGGCGPHVSHRPSLPTTDLEGRWMGIDIQNCREEEEFKNLRGPWGPTPCLFAKVVELFVSKIQRSRFHKLLCIQVVPYNCHLLMPLRTCMTLHWSLERLESKHEIQTRGKVFQSVWLPISSPDPPQACRKS